MENGGIPSTADGTKDDSSPNKAALSDHFLTTPSEREKIVAWLRKEGAEMFREMSEHKDWTPDWISLREQGETYEVAADAIERGEHLNEGEEG